MQTQETQKSFPGPKNYRPQVHILATCRACSTKILLDPCSRVSWIRASRNRATKEKALPHGRVLYPQRLHCLSAVVNSPIKMQLYIIHSDIVFIAFERIKTWGSFHESPGKFGSPKTNIQITKKNSAPFCFVNC